MFAQSYDDRSPIWFRVSDVRRIYVVRRGSLGPVSDLYTPEQPSTYQAYVSFYDNTRLPLEAKRESRAKAELDCVAWADLLSD